MWVIFRKTDRRIVGLTAESGKDAPKETALQEVVQGLVKPGELAEYDAVQVTDREKAGEFLAAFPDKLALKGPLTGLQLVIREPMISTLHVTTDAKDVHPVDGIPEIPADGSSFATITVQKIDDRKKPQRGPGDNDQLYLRASHGVLKDAEGKNEINAARLQEGKAVFRLVSEPVKRVATVEILSAVPELQDASLRIEFI